MLDFDEGEQLLWYGDVGVHAFGPSEDLDSPTGDAVGLCLGEAVALSDEVCVTSTRIRFLAAGDELATLALEDLDVIVIDDATVLLRVEGEETHRHAVHPLTFRAAVERAHEAAGHPRTDFGAAFTALLEQAGSDVQNDARRDASTEPATERGSTP